jgi:hypothetical protein
MLLGIHLNVFSNNAVSGSDYTALNDRILVKWE